MSHSTGGIRCPICRQPTLNVGEPAQGPALMTVIDGTGHLLKPISCNTCTAVWFIYGEAGQIDWNNINRLATEHDDRRGA